MDAGGVGEFWQGGNEVDEGSVVTRGDGVVGGAVGVVLWPYDGRGFGHCEEWAVWILLVELKL